MAPVPEQKMKKASMSSSLKPSAFNEVRSSSGVDAKLIRWMRRKIWGESVDTCNGKGQTGQFLLESAKIKCVKKLSRQVPLASYIHLGRLDH